ncbi:hypothetical protein RvY_05765 [Ramazzottius varieornatus]|uniref:Uncharacterized protein n=1 Tax=Ramazzottius varieornatus TaxID=947166 RepID=A0A1D1V1R9_RAMVA|nr:hypothetical protein RvY_05765 [Ramazzottius varieornatus]
MELKASRSCRWTNVTWPVSVLWPVRALLLATCYYFPFLPDTAHSEERMVPHSLFRWRANRESDESRDDNKDAAWSKAARFLSRRSERTFVRRTRFDQFCLRWRTKSSVYVLAYIRVIGK